MAGKRKITVEFLGNERDLQRAVNNVDNSMSTLGSRMAKVGKIAAAGLAVGAVVAGKALFDMGKAAMEDAQSQALLAKALENSAGATKGQVAATEDWITAQGKALGVADDKLRPALANLVRATGDVGKAQKLAALAMDISAGTGKDLSTVSIALAKAQNGQTSSLGRLGLNMKDANGKAVDFEEAQRRLAKQFGGAAATNAETFAGKMSRLKLMFDETKESIGAKLLPVAERFATWFVSTAVPAISKFSAEANAKLRPIFEWIKTNVPPILSELSGAFQRNFASIKSTVESVLSIVESLWATFGETILSYVRSTWQNIQLVIGGALKIVSGIFKTFSSLLKGDWRGVWEGIKQILSGAWSAIKGIVMQGLNLVKTVFRLGWDGIKALVGAAWEGIKTLASKGVGKLVDVVKGIGSKVASVAVGLFDGLKNAFKSAVNWIIDKWNGLEFGVPGLPKIQTPDIPRLAKGGIVKARPGGTLALIGEAGHDEAVVPLTGPNAPKAMVQAAGTMQQPAIVINISGALDPDATARRVQQMLLRLKRNNGNVSLGIA